MQVATFYTMFNRSRIGKYHVMVCETTPCMLCGARQVADALKKHLGLGYGQTSKVRGTACVTGRCHAHCRRGGHSLHGAGCLLLAAAYSQQ